MQRDWWYVAGTAAAIIVIWWFARRKPIVAAAAPAEAAGAFPIMWDSPMIQVYESNPGTGTPPDNTQLTILIQNQSPSLLSDQYIPLFGFVGIAQGELFQ